MSVATISSILSTEIKDRYDNDLILSNQVDFLSSTLSTEIKDRYDNDLILSNWIEKEEGVRFDNDTDLSNWCNNLSIKLDNEISDRISNDTDLSNWIIKEEKVRLSNDTELSNQVEFLSGEISTLNNNFNVVSSDYNTFIESTFTSLCSEHHDSSIMNLCILDEKHIDGKGHNKYYMTFKDGTLVLKKIN